VPFKHDAGLQRGNLTAQDHVDRVVDLAYRHLDMDAALVSLFQDGRQVYRAGAGRMASFGAELGSGPPLSDTLCARMVEGDIPHLIPDVAADDRVSGLAAVTGRRIGAYVGVPVVLPDGEVYGCLCCLSHDAQPDLTVRDVKFLHMLSGLLTVELGNERQRQRQGDEIAGILDRRELAIVLQPVVALATGRSPMLEALARFQIGSPDEVFATADTVGLRIPLEELAVEVGLGMLRQLAPTQALAINVAPDVAIALSKGAFHDLPLDRIVMEITEHAAVSNYRELRQALDPLRVEGLRLAVDDAGAGFASLRHIVELAPDIIKIDRSLVSGLEADRARRSVVTSLVVVALDLDAFVVAEGVETWSELEAVTDSGVDAVQGYLLGRPSADPEQLRRWTSGQPLLSLTDAGPGMPRCAGRDRPAGARSQLPVSPL